MKSIKILSPILALSVGAAHGALVAYEGFNYTAGEALNEKNGGTGWAGAWTNNGDGSVILTPGLTYTDSNSAVLPTVGNSGQFASDNDGNFRSPTLTPETVGTSLYISFIAKMDSATSGQYAGVSLFQGGGETMFLGDPSAPSTWGIDPKDGTVNSGATSVDTQVFLVYRIDFLAASAEIRMFENPLLSTEPLNAEATASATRTSVLDWDRVRIQSGNGGGKVDELRIGTTYADVVPEPGVFSLLGIAAVAMCLRRKVS